MWSKMTVEPNKTYYWKIGEQEVFLKKIGQEWKLYTQGVSGISEAIILGEEKDVDIDVAWSTVVGEKNNTLLVLPAFPDRPIVVKPSNTFQVLPGKSIQLYIPIPMWVQFYAGTRKKENLFFESHSQELSSTWFGESDNGVLAYSLSSDISGAIQQYTRENTSYVVCPLKLINDSNELLDVQRLLLRCDFLTIFSDGQYLCANEIRIKFKGENEVSDVHYGGHAPSFLDSPSQIATARGNKHQGVISKSFHFIKSLTNHQNQI